MNNTGNRIIYLDVLRAICMMLVIYCHYIRLSDSSFAGNILMTLAWSAVPCFMMVSGSLMHHSDNFSWKKYLKKLLTTFIVICVWRLIYLIVYLCMGTSVPGAGEAISYLLFFRDIDGVNTGVMWYMAAYMIVLFIYPVTHFLFRKAGKAGRIIMLFLMIITGVSGILLFSANWFMEMLSSKTGLNFPGMSSLEIFFPFTNYANMIFYFIAGAFLFEYKEIINKRKSLMRGLSAAGVIIGTVGLIAVKYADSSVLTWGGVYISNGYRHLCTAIIAVSMYVLFSLFEFRGFFAFIGKTIGGRTLGIYYMHYIMLAVCSRYLYDRLPQYFFGMNLIKTVIIVVICAFLSWLIGKIPIAGKLVK